VLAVGCGTGVEVRALKRRPAFQGEIVGVDQSAALLEDAQRLTAEEEVERWRAELARDVAAGIFFGASNYYTYLARRATATSP
jgi:trans-aconitate methyltransferase